MYRSVAIVLVFAAVALPGCGSDKDSPTATANDVATQTPPKSMEKPEAKENPKPQTSEPELDRPAILVQSRDLAEKGDYQRAASGLEKLLVADPDDLEVLFQLAVIKSRSGDLQTAVSLLGNIPEDHPQAGLPALGQSADWCIQLEQYDEAEKRYRKILDRAPGAAPALRQLAYILNRQGRRLEAAHFIRELCKQGNIRQDELHSLVSLGDAMYDAPSELPKNAATQQNPYWPIGVLAEARKQFNDQDFQKVVGLLHPSVTDQTASPAAVALYGRAAVESQNNAAFQWWLSQTNDQTRELSDYWAAVGAHLLDERRFEEATRALAEAIDRDPTDLASMSRIRKSLATLGKADMAKRWVDRWTAVYDVVVANNRVASTQPPDAEAIAELVSMMSALDRPLEALLWKSLQVHYEHAPRSEMETLNAQRKTLLASGKPFPDQQARLCGLDIDAYPMPKLAVSTKSAPQLAENETKKVAPAHFENVASSIGFDHTYRVESKPIKQHFSIYQTLGGGVAVVDYDLDGDCDLYLAQGGADPPSFAGTISNQLFRHQGDSLVNRTTEAAAVETQYSIGVTAGDWNQDGFPDLAIANIGTNTLMINNGDGTFSSLSTSQQSNKTLVPTSLAMADVTGDQLPDLFQVCYIDDAKMSAKPPLDKDGKVTITVSPNNFDPCTDRLLHNDAMGGFTVETMTSQSDSYTGLGVVITDLDARDGNEVFVGNDTLPNQLWTRSADKEKKMLDTAPMLGCAYGFSGGATGAMGIAVGDFDNTGSIDIHITNYENENANLFLQKQGAFQDRNVQYRLDSASRNLVGFGSQPIDYDNDGSLDLTVSNGHLDDALSIRGTYNQPIQLFCNLGDRFQLVDVTDSSNYWNSNHVGRALAKLDFNRDGKNDIVVTHVEQPSALLLNRSPSSNNWLQLQLVGTDTERDSIGAKVSVFCGQSKWNGWVVAGDGYLCRNENVVSFGLGQTETIDKITVNWPSGSQQVFEDLQPDRRLLITENEAIPFTLFQTPR